MRSMSLWLSTLTVAGSTATVLHLIFFTALSWGALRHRATVQARATG